MQNQTNTIKLVVNQTPEVLERILRVVRHRGFKVELMHWDSEFGSLELTVSSQRALHLLTLQLEKLIDVKQVFDISALSCEKSA